MRLSCDIGTKIAGEADFALPVFCGNFFLRKYWKKMVSKIFRMKNYSLILNNLLLKNSFRMS